MLITSVPLAHRLDPLQNNVFNQMDEAKAAAQRRGIDIVDLSIGSSDLSPPPEVIATLAAAIQDPSTYGYTLFQGTAEFRAACGGWYERRFGLRLDPETEITPLIGSQEGTGLLPLAVLNPGEVALLGDPYYPSHAGGVYLAGGRVETVPLLGQNGFLPDFDQIPMAVRQRAKLLILSYPHNPTTAVADLGFWRRAVRFCQEYGILLVHDFPYADWVFEGETAPSVLQADPERTISVECFSLSKSFHMGGFRVGFMVGNARLIQGINQVRSAINFNQYSGILRGATVALQGSDAFPQQSIQVFRARRDRCVQALAQVGWRLDPPMATPYLWLPIPKSCPHNSAQFCIELVGQTGVALAPGSGFGPAGEGYVRAALVQPEARLVEAIGRMGDFVKPWL